MPRIFDWYEKEYNIRPDLNCKIFPKAPEVPETPYENGNENGAGMVSREQTLSPQQNL